MVVCIIVLRFSLACIFRNSDSELVFIHLVLSGYQCDGLLSEGKSSGNG